MKKFNVFLAFLLVLSTSCSLPLKSPDRTIASQLATTNGEENLPKSLKELLYEEQNLHNKDLWGAGAFSSDIDPAFVPERNPKFALAYYLIPEDNSNFLSSEKLDPRIKSQLLEEVDGKRYYKMFIHPESEAHYEFMKGVYTYISQEESEFMASPTSSYRSLVVWNNNDSKQKPFIAKVSLDRNVIGSIDRLVSENEVERSVANQRVFEKIGNEKLEEMGAKIFPESAGLTLKEKLPGAPEKLGGQLIREIPDDVVTGGKKWFSFSALMSPMKKPPIIMDLIKQSGMTSYDFYKKHMIDNYLKMFENVSLKAGINFEPHSQNLVFETTSDLKPTGKWVIRDFGGVWPDVVTMAKNNGPVDIYMDESSAAKFKLRGGRANYISSYVFFYKRQVFDMMLEEVAKYDPSMTANKKNALKAELDSRYLKLINYYLNLNLKTAPTMATYRQIEELVLNSTKYNSHPSDVVISDVEKTEKYIKEKMDLKEWIEFSSAKSQTKHIYYLTNHGIYKTSEGQIIGLALFNDEEKKYYKANKTLPQFKPKVSAVVGGDSCVKMVNAFF